MSPPRVSFPRWPRRCTSPPPVLAEDKVHEPAPRMLPALAEEVHEPALSRLLRHAEAFASSAPQGEGAPQLVPQVVRVVVLPPGEEIAEPQSEPQSEPQPEIAEPQPQIAEPQIAEPQPQIA